MTLPDGRMWGLIDVDSMLAVMGRSGSVADRAVLAVVDDWSFDLVPRRVDVETSDSRATICKVFTPDNTWRVEVLAGRELPVITCGAPGGSPAKPGREWVVASVERLC